MAAEESLQFLWTTSKQAAPSSGIELCGSSGKNPYGEKRRT
jgi:hypothetical protein